MADGPGHTGSHIAYCVLHGVCRVQNIADEEEREIRRLVLKAIAAAAPHRAAARLSAMLHSNAAPLPRAGAARACDAWQVIEAQLKKVQLKLKYFEHMEGMLERSLEEVCSRSGALTIAHIASFPARFPHDRP
jgi:hypothetical protein